MLREKRQMERKKDEGVEGKGDDGSRGEEEGKGGKEGDMEGKVEEGGGGLEGALRRRVESWKESVDFFPSHTF